jgi:hypothetical protein
MTVRTNASAAAERRALQRALPPAESSPIRLKERDVIGAVCVETAVAVAVDGELRGTMTIRDEGRFGVSTLSARIVLPDTAGELVWILNGPHVRVGGRLDPRAPSTRQLDVIARIPSKALTEAGHAAIVHEDENATFVRLRFTARQPHAAGKGRRDPTCRPTAIR